MSSVGIDSFVKKKEEKNVFQSLFGCDSQDSSESERESETESEAVDGPHTTRADTDKDHLLGGEELDEISYFQSSFHGELCPLRVAIRERKILGIAHQLWPAAGYLCDYLLSHPDILFDESNIDEQSILANNPVQVIELGAGLGLTGIYLAAYFNQPAAQRSVGPSVAKVNVTCTDIAEAIPGISENIMLNQATLDTERLSLEDEKKTTLCAYAQELFWGNDEHVHRLMLRLQQENPCRSPVVIAADVVYWESLFVPLLQTIALLCNEYDCDVVIAHVKRWKKDSKFFALCKKHNLIVTILEEQILRERDAHHNNPDNEDLKKTIHRIYRIQGVKKRT
jgi:hypothetical protein